jgi:hypothetical protein
MITRSGTPDMRIKTTRHNPGLVIAQAMEEQATRLFREMGHQDIEDRGENEELSEEYPMGLEGQTTGRPDMRLRPMRHDPRLVAMQEVMDRVRYLRTQISINQDIIEGEKDSLPTMRELFESDFLDAGDLAGLMTERVPDYETLRKAHEKYGQPQAAEAAPASRRHHISAPPPVAAQDEGEEVRPAVPARPVATTRRLSSGRRRAA